MFRDRRTKISFDRGHEVDENRLKIWKGFLPELCNSMIEDLEVSMKIARKNKIDGLVPRAIVDLIRLLKMNRNIW